MWHQPALRLRCAPAARSAALVGNNLTYRANEIMVRADLQFARSSRNQPMPHKPLSAAATIRASELWRGGRTARQVAAALCGDGAGQRVTREMVIEAAERAGWDWSSALPRERGSKTKPAANGGGRVNGAPAPARAPASPKPLAPEPAPVVASNGHQPKALLDLAPFGEECRWPLGDGPFLFCARPTWRDGAAYCVDHACKACGGIPEPRRALVDPQPNLKRGGVYGS